MHVWFVKRISVQLKSTDAHVTEKWTASTVNIPPHPSHFDRGVSSVMWRSDSRGIVRGQRPRDVTADGDSVWGRGRGWVLTTSPVPPLSLTLSPNRGNFGTQEGRNCFGVPRSMNRRLPAASLDTRTVVSCISSECNVESAQPACKRNDCTYSTTNRCDYSRVVRQKNKY